eukprot:TRINITY_DN7968_c0_g1_i1.p1 TRINITY_DN7968_c0_g1~~TRINITY_DN7968_c0_g1_i1.p1  ORF type:complete len:630 (+),score=34.31 TRINITY_DN7968_c0_g1_i1:41-1930(+)
MPIFDESHDGRCWSGGVPLAFWLGGVPIDYSGRAGNAAGGQRGTWRTSLAELQRMFKSPLILVSAPQFGMRRCGNDDAPQYDVPVMSISESLPERLKPSVRFSSAYDFKGSATDRIANTRIRWIDSSDGSRTLVTSEHDFGLDYTVLGLQSEHVPERPALRTCSDSARQSIENSFWFCTWWGQVSGSVAQHFHTVESVTCKKMPQIFSTSLNLRHALRVVIVVSIDGGPITQVEKSWLPQILLGVLSNVRRRGYDWSDAAEVLWCHFPTIEDMVSSLDGECNLVHDWTDGHSFSTDIYGRPTTLACAPDPNRRKVGKSLFRQGVGDPATAVMCDLSSDPSISFCRAAQGGDMGTLEYLRNNSDLQLVEQPSPSDEWKRPPLHRAAAKGQVAAMRFILNGRADVKETCAFCNFSALHWACFLSHKDPGLVELLLQHSADVEQLATFPDDCQMPLHIAASCGNVPQATALITHNADPNCRTSPLGRTPLHMAVLFGHPQMIECLLSLKAFVNAMDTTFRCKAAIHMRGSYTPLHRTVSPMGTLYFQTRIEEARILVAQGADPKLCNPEESCCCRTSPLGLLRRKICLLRCCWCFCRRRLKESYQLRRIFSNAPSVTSQKSSNKVHASISEL